MPQLIPISPRGTITLPKVYREKHNFKTPGKVKLQETAEGIEIKPLPNFLNLYGALDGPHDGKPLNFSSLREEFENEIAQRKHG